MWVGVMPTPIPQSGVKGECCNQLLAQWWVPS